jgi:hypothetical protein
MNAMPCSEVPEGTIVENKVTEADRTLEAGDTGRKMSVF